MKIINPSVELMGNHDGQYVLKHIEACGRTCYQSEAKGATAERFVRSIIRRGHESVLEHYSFTLRFICDRGVSHEIVRHRLASYSQESTRYCCYEDDKFGREITVIRPIGLTNNQYSYWGRAMIDAECAYIDILKDGGTPEMARSVLPNSLKTTLVMTADLREWRHFFKLRCDNAAHPQMRQVALMGLEIANNAFPVFFEDIAKEYLNNEIKRPELVDLPEREGSETTPV